MWFFQTIAAVSLSIATIGVVSTILEASLHTLGMALLLPFALAKVPDLGVFILKVVYNYLLVSIVLLFALGYFQHHADSGVNVTYAVAGGAALFVALLGGLIRSQRAALAEGEPARLRWLRFEGRVFIGSMFYYVVGLLVPSLVINALTLAATSVVFWLMNLPVVGFILDWVGIAFLVGFLYHILMYGYILHSTRTSNGASLTTGP